jgi:hypothetical protein
MKDIRRLLAMRWLATVATLALALGAVACGGSDDSSDGNAAADNGADAQGEARDIDTSTPEGQVEATVFEFVDAMRKPDPKTACSYLTPTVQDQFLVVYKKAKKCEDVVRYVAPKVYPNDPTVRDVKVSGNKATLGVVAATGDRVQALEMTKSAGRWKISDGFDQAPKDIKKKKD